MRAYELVAMWIAAGAVVVPVVTWVVLWLLRRDRIFVGVAPGDVPSDIEDASTRRVGPGTEYWGEVPLRSVPPPGISPGLAGVVLDGTADGRDISAMVLDLARRGWLVLADAPGGNHDRDWQITRVDQPLDATLDLNEVYLITNIATPGGTTRMSELRSRRDNRLGLVQLDLAREVVARGWYPAPPSQPSDVPMAVLGLGGLLGIVVALMNVTPVSLTAGSVVVACAYLTSLIVRGDTPRTALGTAVRVQVLGFRRYLEDARSHQFSYIDAAGIFREYLPWAVVFGLEQRWAEVFAELDVVAEVADVHLAQDLRWFAGIKGPGDALTPPERRELEGPPRRPALGIAEASEPTVVPAPESGHAVRQWIPRPSVRRTALEPRPRPAMPGNEPVSGPTAPVTPRRPPPLDETVAVLVPSATTSPPRPQPPWSDWLVELDLAMSGDFDVHGPDATDGGTVISGPERFDVLLTPPLWPDIPLDTRPDHRVG